MTRTNLLETRLLYWSSQKGNMEYVAYFLGRKCSPFMVDYDGYNALHIASYMGHYKIIKLIVCSDYEYFEFQELLKDKKIKINELEQHTFNKKESLNVLSRSLPSNALHLTIEQENYHCMKILLKEGVSTETINYRTLKPFELTYNKKIQKFYKQHIKHSDPNNFIEMGYMYVI